MENELFEQTSVPKAYMKLSRGNEYDGFAGL